MVRRALQLGRLRCLILAGSIEEARKDLLPFLADQGDLNSPVTLLLRASLALADLKMTLARDLLRQAYQAAKGGQASEGGACMSFDAELLAVERRFSESASLLERAWVQRRSAAANCPAELMTDIVVFHNRAGNTDATATWFSVLAEAQFERQCCRFRQFVGKIEYELAQSRPGAVSADDVKAAFEVAIRMQCPVLTVRVLELVGTFSLREMPAWATDGWWRSIAKLLRGQGHTKLARYQSWLALARLHDLAASSSVGRSSRKNHRLAVYAQDRADHLLCIQKS